MESPNVINVTDILNESGELCCVFNRQDDSTWIPHGRYKVIGRDGRLRIEITYDRGVAHGPYVDYWSTGNVSLEGQYVEGKWHGTWHFYNKDGTLREVMQFDMGKEKRPPLRGRSKKEV